MPRPAHRHRWVAPLAIGFAGMAIVASHRAASTAAPAAVPPADREPLTRIAEIKSSFDAADHSLPVEVEGVVTFAGAAGNFFLHDGALGIHVGPSEPGRRLQPGDRVRVRGMARPGTFAPAIDPRELIPLGRGTLPEPRRASFSALASGTLDGQWLEIDGVVCDVNAEASTGVTVLDVAFEGRRLRATVHSAQSLAAEVWIDAEVRLHGAASGSFNRQRQLVEPVLRVPGPAFVAVVRPPPADPFGAPRVRLNRLLGFSLEAPGPHRVCIRGVVTRRLAERVVFVRDENRGLRVETRAAAAFNPGDVIEAVGFPTMSGGAAVMQSAIARVVESGAPPVAVRPAWAELADGTHDGDLVSVQARLVDWVAAGDVVSLVLQAGDQLLRATLPATAAGALPEKNSLVEAIGICALAGTEDRPGSATRGVMLLVAEPADLIVLRRPDWWTAQRLAYALAAVLGLLGAGLGWVWSLRGQVRRKGAVIEQQARHAAVLEERSRIARDLHDTLEQELTGLSLQLKLAEMDCRESPERVGPGLEAARHTLRRTRALAHQAIRRLRTDELTRRDEPLAVALRRIVETWTHSGLSVGLAVSGQEQPLPRETERHLLSIAAEAMTNAVKHGRARSIDVTLRYESETLYLEISDNGTGFDVGGPAANGEGRFGIVGMRERASAIGGQLDVRSQPGAGTAVIVQLPWRQPTASASPRAPAGAAAAR